MSAEMNYLSVGGQDYEVADAAARRANSTNATAIANEVTARESAVSAEQTAREAGDTAINEDITEINTALKDVAPVIVGTASGYVASITDGADNKPLLGHVFHINPIQGGEGDPSADNIRSIIGYTILRRYRSAKNLLCPATVGTSTNNGVTFTVNEDGSVHAVGTAGSNGAFINYGYFNTTTMLFPRNIRLYVGGGTNNIGVRMIWTRWGSTTSNTLVTNYNRLIPTSFIYNDSRRASWVRICVPAGATADGTVYPTVYLDDSTEYEAPSTVVSSVDWGDIAGTVYGGEYDSIAGKLKVFPYYASYNGETLVGPWVSDRDVYVEGTTPTIGAQVVDMGGTPTEYDVEAPSVFNTYKGENNYWSNIGTVDVEYRADTKAYIDTAKADEEGYIDTVIDELAIKETVSGAVASFADGGDNLKVDDLIVTMNPFYESGDGDPSPTNIRPLGAWYGTNVHISPTTDAADGTTVNIDWTDDIGVVRGGTLNIITGELTRTWAAYASGLETESWSRLSSATGYVYYFSPSPVKENGLSNVRSNKYKSSSSNSQDKTIRGSSNTSAIYIRDDDYTTVADFKAAQADLQIAYERETPQVYHLSPTEIRTLLGQNNIWADGDTSTSVTYKADTKMYIDNKIAAIVATMSET